MADEPILPVQQPPAVPQPPPSTVAPKLDSISQEDLSRELKGEAPPQKAIFGDGKENVRVGGDGEGGVADKVMPDFGAKAREMMAKKEAEAKEAKSASKADEVPDKKEEKKIEPKVEEKKEAVAEDVPEDERKVLPHDKPSTAKRINYFIRENAKLAKELDEAKKTAIAAPTQANVEEVTKLRTEYQQAQDELLKFRRRYEIDNDAEFKSKYDEPVNHAEAAIESTLKKYQLGDATLKAIKDEGGFAAFSRSSRTFPVQESDGEGGIKTVMRTAGELARNWLNALPIADAEMIKQAVGKQQILGQEKQSAVERAVGESKAFFEARQAEQAKQQQAAQASQAELTAKYEARMQAAIESTEWIKDKPVPANATDDQRKVIDDYNAFNKELRTRLEKNPTSSEEYVDLKVDAAHAHHLRREAGDAAKRIEALEAELARVKAGNRTTPKGGSLLSDKGKPAPKDDGIDPTDFKTGFRKAVASASGEDE